MLSASLVVQARRRAGLSQRELAARAGVAQQEIARYERGRVTPSIERLRSLIAACGLELTFGLARADDSYDAQIEESIALMPAARLERAVRDAQPLRGARAQAAGQPPPARADVPSVLRALQRAGVRYVLVGELAEVLHGSPLLPLTSSVAIVPQAGQREKLTAAIVAIGGTGTPALATLAIDATMSFALDKLGMSLDVVPAPAGTRGYDDLRRDAAAVRLRDEVEVMVASLIDLVRIAEAAGDQARVPALRRTLELATDGPTARAA